MVELNQTKKCLYLDSITIRYVIEFLWTHYTFFCGVFLIGIRKSVFRFAYLAFPHFLLLTLLFDSTRTLLLPSLFVKII